METVAVGVARTLIGSIIKGGGGIRGEGLLLGCPRIQSDDDLLRTRIIKAKYRSDSISLTKIYSSFGKTLGERAN